MVDVSRLGDIGLAFLEGASGVTDAVSARRKQQDERLKSAADIRLVNAQAQGQEITNAAAQEELNQLKEGFEKLKDLETARNIGNDWVAGYWEQRRTGSLNIIQNRIFGSESPNSSAVAKAGYTGMRSLDLDSRDVQDALMKEGIPLGMLNNEADRALIRRVYYNYSSADEGDQLGLWGRANAMFPKGTIPKDMADAVAADIEQLTRRAIEYQKGTGGPGEEQPTLKIPEELGKRLLAARDRAARTRPNASPNTVFEEESLRAQGKFTELEKLRALRKDTLKAGHEATEAAHRAAWMEAEAGLNQTELEVAEATKGDEIALKRLEVTEAETKIIGDAVKILIPDEADAGVVATGISGLLNRYKDPASNLSEEEVMTGVQALIIDQAGPNADRKMVEDIARRIIQDVGIRRTHRGGQPAPARTGPAPSPTVPTPGAPSPGVPSPGVPSPGAPSVTAPKPEEEQQPEVPPVERNPNNLSVDAARRKGRDQSVRIDDFGFGKGERKTPGPNPVAVIAAEVAPHNIPGDANGEKTANLIRYSDTEWLDEVIEDTEGDKPARRSVLRKGSNALLKNSNDIRLNVAYPQNLREELLPATRNQLVAISEEREAAGVTFNKGVDEGNLNRTAKIQSFTQGFGSVVPNFGSVNYTPEFLDNLRRRVGVLDAPVAEFNRKFDVNLFGGKDFANWVFAELKTADAMLLNLLSGKNITTGEQVVYKPIIFDPTKDDLTAVAENAGSWTDKGLEWYKGLYANVDRPNEVFDRDAGIERILDTRAKMYFLEYASIIMKNKNTEDPALVGLWQRLGGLSGKEGQYVRDQFQMMVQAAAPSMQQFLAEPKPEAKPKRTRTQSQTEIDRNKGPQTIGR